MILKHNIYATVLAEAPSTNDKYDNKITANKTEHFLK